VRLAQALDRSVANLFARAEGEPNLGALIEILLVEDNPRDVDLTLRAFRQARDHVGELVPFAAPA